MPTAGRAPGPARVDARGRTGRPGDPVAPAAGGSAAGNGRPAESGAAPGRSQVPGARAGGRGSRRALSLTADEAPDQATGAGLPGALPDRAGPAETPARRGGAAPAGRRSGRPQADRADGPYPTDGGGPLNGAPAAGDGTLGGAAPGDRTGGREPRAPRRQEQRAGALTVGAARAGALLERQLTLARTRAHTAALQALGSSRFHAVADAVALLASEVPLDPSAAEHPAEQVLPPLADLAHRRLVEAVEALPLGRAGHPYNAEALVHGLAATPAADAPPASDQQDAPWHQVRRLVRMRRYALEVLDEGQRAAATGLLEVEPSLSVRLLAAAQALERHRDAAEAATAAATAARTPRIAPATAYALGVLHADQRHEVEAARFAFGRVWQRSAAGTP
ncbi:hypothetical protein [Streptomyces sp. NPDC018031]|uniref:hypothetical protein n=1 Tax=Streptomyces sp. NPDC018031 TaxID=3365033 RepID=UPI00379C6C17